MTANLLPSLQARYVPTADLWPERPMPNVRTTNPNEAEREDLLLSKLGPRGWGRIHHFRHYYAQGWGERGHGRPLSPRSLEAFFRYLDEQAFRFNERKEDDQGRFLKGISGVIGKGLRYAKLIGEGQEVDGLPA